ncbi:MAG: hypothetical protein KGH75_00895 [Rhodospirillales bacterium]|nr:hypothetical protein [Rhodospirillales bacterium]
MNEDIAAAEAAFDHALALFHARRDLKRALDVLTDALQHLPPRALALDRIHALHTAKSFLEAACADLAETIAAPHPLRRRTDAAPPAAPGERP